MKEQVHDFKIFTRPVKYGDGKKFVNYRIAMFSSSLVGVEEGPGRTFTDRGAAVKAARARILVLRTHRLFGVRVTERMIREGEARNCNTCAIAQALWHNQEEMGLPKQQWNFEVSPYAAFAKPRGIVLSHRYSDVQETCTPAESLPEMVYGIRDGRIAEESMVEWAMNFDDWKESRSMGLKMWREEHGHKDGERPMRPEPASFVLDLDSFEPLGDLSKIR